MKLQDGKVPGVEVDDSSDGQRWVIGHSVLSDELGQVLHESGVFEAHVGPIPTANAIAHAQAADAERLQRGEAPQGPPPVVSEELAQRVAAAGPDEVVQVVLFLAIADVPAVHVAIQRAIGLGEVVNENDLRATEKRIHEQRQKIIAQGQKQILGLIGGAGGAVDFRCTDIPCIVASVPSEAVSMLASEPSVVYADVEVKSTPLACTSGQSVYLNGEGINDVLQVQQLWDFQYTAGGSTWNYDGNNGPGADIITAVVEGWPYRVHIAFNDTSSGSPRVQGMWDCNSSCCGTATSWVQESNGPNFYPGSVTCGVARSWPWGGQLWEQHATLVAGAAIQDATDDQDQTVPNTPQEELWKSAPGREGKAYLYVAPNKLVALNHAAGVSPKPRMLNMSYGDSATNCLALGAHNLAVDALFEAGVLPVAALGNSGGSPTSCTSAPPATAAGALAVGAFGDDDGGDDGIFQDCCSARDGWYAGSNAFGPSFGGGPSTPWSQAGGRSIVDVAGPWQVWDRTSSAGVWYPWSYLGNIPGTSVAAPTVMSSLVAFSDMYEREIDSWIQDPGALSALALIMGDGGTYLGGFQTSSFDPRLGAGRLQLRMLNQEGLDSPYMFHDGAVCVAQGESVTIPLNGGTSLPADMDTVKVVAWWFNEAISTYQAYGNNIDLKLTIGTNSYLSSSAWDEKERVWVTNAPSGVASLSIDGTYVPAFHPSPGCTGPRQRVYYAVLGEDDDRDDSGSLLGPQWNSSTCGGVAPMSWNAP